MRAHARSTDPATSHEAAANIPIGSALMLGSNTTKQDRNLGTAFDIFDGMRVVKKETYDASNTAIYLNAAATFNNTVGTFVQSAPWNTGACDVVVGDGSPTSNTAGRVPFVLQGIEMMLGMIEVLGDVILQSTGSGWQIYINPDSKNEATAVTGNSVATGKYSPSGAADGSQYPVTPAVANGMLFGTRSGGSTTTGLCDGVWASATTETGSREWRSLGSLRNDSLAGLWHAAVSGPLSGTNWGIGSRLSAIGRGGGVSA